MEKMYEVSSKDLASSDVCETHVKIKTFFAKIIFCVTAKKPYYQILYFSSLDNRFHIGYGSYCLELVFQWLEEEFEIEEIPNEDDIVPALRKELAADEPIVMNNTEDIGMDEYIKRGEAIHRIRDLPLLIGFQSHAVAISAAITAIERMHAVDAVEVVRCKDCVHSDDECHKDGLRYCMRGIKARDYNETGYIYPVEEVVRDVDFCSYGERRTDEAG